MSAAYEVLSDPDKKQVYDQARSRALPPRPARSRPPQHGEEGLKRQAGQQQHGGGFHGGFPGGFQGGFHFGGGGFPGGDPFGFHRQQQQPRAVENLYEYDSPVSNLKQGRFPGHDARHVWLVEFYAPWCQHCQQMVPVWEQLARELAGVIKVGAVNCELEKGLCAMHSATSFPLVKLLRGGSSVAMDGTAPRTRDAVWQWAHDQLPTAQLKSLSPRRPETLDAFLSGPCAAPHVQVEGGACVVLFQREQTTEAWLKSLSFAHRARVPMGEAKGQGVENLAARLGVTRVPAAVALCSGDARRTLEAPQPQSTTAMEAWVAGLAAACAKTVVKEKPKLQVGADYGKMRVAELRALLASRGAGCPMCVEKADFVREVEQLALAEAAAATEEAAAASRAAADAQAKGGSAQEWAAYHKAHAAWEADQQRAQAAAGARSEL